MPGKLQTEYMRNFKWSNRPIRFKQPTASLDPKRSVCQPPRAGLTSSQLGIQREPAFQVKNRSASPVEIVPLPSSEPKIHYHRSSSHHEHRSSKQGLSLSASGSILSNVLYRPAPQLANSAKSEDAPPAGKPTWKRAGDPASAVADDFILIGSQAKFAPSIAYRLRKPLDASRLSQVAPQRPPAERVEEVTQTADLAAPSQIIVQSPPVARYYTADENIQVELPKNNLTPPPSPPDAPRREKSPEPAAAVQTEAIQTDVDDHYAIRRRLGLVSRANAGRFQTEYGRQFNPTHAVSAPSFRRMKQQEADSPVMNAEQMFHRSRSRSPPGPMPKVLLQTEYGRSFKPYQWQLHQQPIRRSLSAEGHEIQYEAHVPSPGEKEHHHHAKDKTVAKIRAMKWPKRYVSEYMSNFRQPSAFRYEDGTWKGVSQPQVVMTQSAPFAAIEGDPSWVAEVRELKSRAKEYQLRNKGTHFSSTHVGQLYSDKARFWDTGAPAATTEEQQVGDGGSRLAMLDFSVPRSVPSIQQEVAPEVAQEYVQVDELPTNEDLLRPAGLPTVRRGNVRESLEWAVQSTESDSVASGSDCSSSAEEPAPPQPVAAPAPVLYRSQPLVQQVVSKLDIPPKSGRSDDSSTSSSSSDVLPSAVGGRVRTSRLAELQATGNGSPRRHHLDVTTPAVGGAILTSPPMPIAEPVKHKKSHSSSLNRINTGESGRSMPNTAGESGYSSRPRSPPAYGKPTSDTHQIVERDQPIQFQYVPTPKDKQPDTNATADSRPMGLIEQLIMERSRDNASVIDTSINDGKASNSKKQPSSPPKKAPLSTKPVVSSRANAKSSQRAVGMMVSIPEPMSFTYKVNGPKSRASKQPAVKVTQKAVQAEQRSPPSRASSATYSAASDILEKARARANFWERTVRI